CVRRAARRRRGVRLRNVRQGGADHQSGEPRPAAGPGHRPRPCAVFRVGRNLRQEAMSNAALRRAWGERAAGWLRSSPNDRIGRDGGSYRLIAAARIAPGMHTLDLGTGAGEPALGIAKIAASVTCADLAFEMLDGARGRARDIGLGNLRYVSADMEALPF